MERLPWTTTATAQASLLVANWMLFAYVGLAVALLVWGLIVFAAVRWRRRESGPPRLPPQFRNNFALEIAWTVLPLALVCVLFVYTYRAEAGVEALLPDPAVTVAVNGYRWGWTFSYRGGPTVRGSFANLPELVLPRGETTRIMLTSSDVNHSFWIPAFLFKRDAIPGRVTAFDVAPTTSGSYVGHCAEFCGYDHALMGFRVKVVAPADFKHWLASPPT
jgi:cytochrome c oxidase subunit 2